MVFRCEELSAASVAIKHDFCLPVARILDFVASSQKPEQHYTEPSHQRIAKHCNSDDELSAILGGSNMSPRAWYCFAVIAERNRESGGILSDVRLPRPCFICFHAAFFGPS